MRKVLVLDSGVGGLNVLDRLLSLRKDVDYIYFADEAYCPYGEKNSEEVVERIQRICSSFVNIADEVVLACNTASVYIYPFARGDASEFGKYSLSLVDSQKIFTTVDATIDRVLQVSSGDVCLLATKLCVNSGVYQAMLLNHKRKCIAVDCSRFVQLIENNASAEERAKIVKQTLDVVKSKALQIDTVVLGCTHFDNLFDEIRNHFCNNVSYVSSSNETANFAARSIPHCYGCGNVEYLSSGNFQYVCKISQQTGRNFKLFDI